MSENGTGSNYSSEMPYSNSEEPLGNSTTEGTSATTHPEVLEAAVREIPLEDLKRELLTSVSTTNRGFVASPSQRKEIITLIEQIERQNPTPAPCDDPQLTGRWRLLFTNAFDIVSLALLTPVALVGQIYQNVYEAEEGQKHDYELTNIVELEPPFAPISNQFIGQTMASVEVAAKGFRKSDVKIDITFTESSFKPETLAGYDVRRLPPLRYGLRSPVGYIETTFLDADIRVARAPPLGGDGGGVFVLLRDALPLK